jgi:hypothetical protein
LLSNRQFPCDSSRLACSGDRITTSGENLTARESTRPRIDGENRTKRLGMLVAMPGHQATAGLSSEWFADEAFPLNLIPIAAPHGSCL